MIAKIRIAAIALQRKIAMGKSLAWVNFERVFRWKFALAMVASEQRAFLCCSSLYHHQPPCCKKSNARE